MIIHSVQLERPLTSANLVGAGIEGCADGTRESTPDSEATKRLEQLLAGIAAGTDQLHARHAEVASELKSFSVRLAMQVVEKIVGSDQSLRAERLESLLSAAFSRTEPVVCIHLNPQDIPQIENYLKTNSTTDPKLTLVATETIEAGECRVDFAAYELASDLAHQVAAIEQRLLEVVNDH